MKKLFALLLMCATAGVSAQNKLYPNEFPLSQVTLLEGTLKSDRKSTRLNSSHAT